MSEINFNSPPIKQREDVGAFAAKTEKPTKPPLKKPFISPALRALGDQATVKSSKISTIKHSFSKFFNNQRTERIKIFFLSFIQKKPKDSAEENTFFVNPLFDTNSHSSDLSSAITKGSIFGNTHLSSSFLYKTALSNYIKDYKKNHSLKGDEHITNFSLDKKNTTTFTMLVEGNTSEHTVKFDKLPNHLTTNEQEHFNKRFVE